MAPAELPPIRDDDPQFFMADLVAAGMAATDNTDQLNRLIKALEACRGTAGQDDKPP